MRKSPHIRYFYVHKKTDDDGSRCTHDVDQVARLVCPVSALSWDIRAKVAWRANYSRLSQDAGRTLRGYKHSDTPGQLGTACISSTSFSNDQRSTTSSDIPLDSLCIVCQITKWRCLGQLATKRSHSSIPRGKNSHVPNMKPELE